MSIQTVITLGVLVFGLLLYLYSVAQQINFMLTVRDIHQMRIEKHRIREEKIKDLMARNSPESESAINPDAARNLSMNLKKMIDADS